MRLDIIRNDVIRDKIGVTSIQDKMKEVRLRSSSHIRRSDNAPIRRY